MLCYSFQSHRVTTAQRSTHVQFYHVSSSSVCVQYASTYSKACFCLPVRLPSLSLSLALHGHLDHLECDCHHHETDFTTSINTVHHWESSPPFVIWAHTRNQTWRCFHPQLNINWVHEKIQWIKGKSSRAPPTFILDLPWKIIINGKTHDI